MASEPSVGAVVFNDLNDRNLNIDFNLENMLRFEANPDHISIYSVKLIQFQEAARY